MSLLALGLCDIFIKSGNQICEFGFLQEKISYVTIKETGKKEIVSEKRIKIKLRKK